jgi:hypothetical protein
MCLMIPRPGLSLKGRAPTVESRCLIMVCGLTTGLWDTGLWDIGLWDTGFVGYRVVGGASRGDYVQDERYIARSTWMCGAIVSGLHSISMDVRRDCVSLAQPISRVRRDCSRFALCLKIAARRASHKKTGLRPRHTVHRIAVQS